MSLAVQSVEPGRLTVRSPLGFDLLFGVLPLLLLSPLLAVEFQSLWHRTAMTFFPIPIFIVGCLAAWHIRSPRSGEPVRLFFARVSFLIGVGFFGVAAWKFSPFLSHCSLVFLFIGWATERLGNVPWPRIAAWAALLATSIRLPGDRQTRLEEWFVQQSSSVLGCILDGLNIPFLVLAKTFKMRDLEFSLSDVCTSVYSVNALASAVVLLLLLTHRSLLVAILSLLTVPVWAFVQLVLVQLSIVLLRHYSQRDATQGLDRALVELTIFMVIVVCCWATTWFFAKFSLPVPAADSGFEPEFQILNSIACWPQPDPFAAGARNIEPSESWQQLTLTASELLRKISWAGAMCAVAFGLFSTYQVARGGLAAQSVPTIRAQQVARVQWKELFPEVFDGLRRSDVTQAIERIEGSDRGVVHWNFLWQGQFIQLSVTLPFTNHPRLATKYEALGWRVLSEQAKRYVPTKRNDNEATAQASTGPDATGPDATGPNATGPNATGPNAAQVKPQLDVESVEPWTELRISNELGGQAIALVTYHPLLDAAHESSSQQNAGDAAQSNMEYQVTLFCESGEALTTTQLNEFYGVFSKVNEHVQSKVEPSLREMLGGAR